MEVRLTPAAAAELESLNEPLHARILRILERLQRWPEVSGVKALRGELVGRFRIRTGDYRVQFQVEGQRIVVEKIGHRDGFYDE